LTGGRSGSPVIDIKPLMPCKIRSRPARWLYGPVWPNADADEKINRGLSADSVS
jgi:hypothetical protein